MQRIIFRKQSCLEKDIKIPKSEKNNILVSLIIVFLALKKFLSYFYPLIGPVHQNDVDTR